VESNSREPQHRGSLSRAAIRGFSRHKIGESSNDDWLARDNKTGVMAVADGATESSYSGLWARILVKGFIECKEAFDTEDMFERFITQLRSIWSGGVPWTELEEAGWPYDEKAAQGAHATFLGVRFRVDGWDAFAVGDCNLFVVSDTGEVLISWPIESPEQFGTTPDVLASVNNQTTDEIWPRILRTSGTIEAGLNLIVCTDALAEYLCTYRNDRCIWQELLALKGGEDSSDWLNRTRDRGMRNDDVTVLIAETRLLPKDSSNESSR
jgi:hypothetical protein